MLRTLVRLSAILFSVGLLGGCMTMGLHETAHTTPRGQFEYGGIVTPVFIPLGTGADGALIATYPELYARLGLSDNSDLGFRWAFGPGMGVDYKTRLASGGVDVAARLGGSFYGVLAGGGGGGFYLLSPRMVISRETKPGLPWAFNAGLDYFGVFATGTGADAGEGFLSLKAGLGLPFRAFEAVRIMPEVGVTVPLSSAGDEYGTDFLFGQGALLTLGVSLGRVASD